MTKWGLETTLKFIQEYIKYEYLWDCKSAAYNDRSKRKSAYLKLVEAMHLPDFGVTDVKNKIKNLRSTYNQEKKKAKDSEDCGLSSVYESKLKWLKELEPAMNVKPKRKTYDHVKDRQETIGAKRLKEIPPLSISAQVKTEGCTPPRKKKAKALINAVSDANHLHKSLNNPDNNEDSFDAFGNSIAKQLRKLSEERALLAQSAIQNLLTEYGIQDIRERKRSKSRQLHETNSSNESRSSSCSP